MQEEIRNHLKLVTKRIEKLSQECQIKNGYNVRTARLRLLTELVREQIDLKIQVQKQEISIL